MKTHQTLFLFFLIVFVANTATAAFTIGQSFAGGIIFYIDASGISGLVAAPADQGNNLAWGCAGSDIAGTGTAIGTGRANTAVVVANCGMPAGLVAARTCDDLVANTYADWYLPSKDELNLMYQNLHVRGLGNFSTGTYWSSSQRNAASAWKQVFASGAQSDALKATTANVRAIRSFSIVKDKDGNIYNVIQIGNHSWLKENLRTRVYRDGTKIKTNLSNSLWASNTTGACTVYDNNPANNETYGKLYNWYAVNNPRGLCPKGWHVAEQLSALINSVSGNGNRLIAETNGGSNTTGFSAGLAGMRNADGNYSGLGDVAGFWSQSSSTSGTKASALFVRNSSGGGIISFEKATGFSCRCIKD